jgi:hypothetical protein
MRTTLPLATLLALVPIQAQDAELDFTNTNTVRSTTPHPTTGVFYPFSPTVPPGYLASPGVQAGTRLWHTTPKLRGQAGSQGTHYVTVTGFRQLSRVGAAVATFPAPNHYQMRCGMGPARAATAPYQFDHDPNGADIFSIADAPVVVTNGPLFSVDVRLTTPIVVPEVNWCFYVEYRGGEWQDDPQGGQTIACDYYGGYAPGGLPSNGSTVGAPPRTVAWSGGPQFRPTIMFYVQEAVMTATGTHSNNYFSPPLATVQHRGIGACRAPWHSVLTGDLFFDVRAGSGYGSFGSAVVFLNFSPNWFPVRLPVLGIGNLMLDPSDPAFAVLSGIVMPLGAQGNFNGVQAPIAVPPLGAAALGTILKSQGLVFNGAFLQPQLTTTSSILVQ